jgi:hypothetical protein
LLVVILIVMLSCPLSTAEAQKSDSMTERIKHSLSENEADWKIIETIGPHQRKDAIQTSLRWRKGTEEVTATIIIYQKLKTAKEQFKRDHQGEASMENFQVKGIGDDAYLFPPKVDKGGAYNLRFRKAQVEVWMSAASDETIRRCAKYVATSVGPPPNQLQRTRN